MQKIKVTGIEPNGNKTEYDSIADAAEAIGCNESTVRRAINNSCKTAGGMTWVSHKQSANRAKILIFDIETAPLQAYVWQLWKQDIYIDQIISEWFMLTWSAKFLGEQTIYSSRLTSMEALEQDDKRITKELWKLLDEADIVIAHNGNRFDVPRIKTRCLVHGIAPPSIYKQIDTKIVAAKEFGFSSNKLEALARLLGFEGKNDTTFDLWADCMKGDAQALKEMEDYNIQDIYVLENVYLALRPYIKGHPNLDLYIDDDKSSCPSCGEKDLQVVKGKYYYTQAVRYQLYRCEDCKALARAKKGTAYKNKRQISAIPR